jgi:hypothetical protein
MLFCDIGQRQEVREGPCDRHCRLDRQPPEKLRERVEISIAAGAAALGQRPDPLDDLVQRRPFPQPERLAQHSSEGPHIVTQPFMGIADSSGHASIIPFRRSTRCGLPEYHLRVAPHRDAHPVRCATEARCTSRNQPIPMSA